MSKDKVFCFCNKCIIVFFFVIAFFSFEFLNAQIIKTDSLEKLVEIIHKDSLLKKCQLYLDLSQYYKSSNNIKSIDFQNKALDNLNKISDEKTKLQCYAVITKFFLNNGYSQEGVKFGIKALELAKKRNDLKYLMKINFYLGSLNHAIGNNNEALRFFMNSYAFANKTNDSAIISHVYNGFGVIYQSQGKYDSAFHFYNKAYQYYILKKDTQLLMTSLNNIGGVLISKQDYNSGLIYLKKFLELSKIKLDKYSEVNALINISNCYERIGDLNLSLEYAESALKISKEYNFIKQKLYSELIIALKKKKRSNYNQSLITSQSLLISAKAEGVYSIIDPIYENIIDCFKSKKDYKSAYEFQNEYSMFKDSVIKGQNENYIEEIKQKYNLEQKDAELVSKNILITQSIKLNSQKNILILLLLILVISAFISLSFYRSRRKAEEKLIMNAQMIKQQKEYFNAYINGQEEERKRIASDLHDGLAQNLTTLKLSFSNFKTTDSTFNDILIKYSNQVNSMINETRMISHNMMPDVLIDLGLVKALKSLINDINTNVVGLQVTLNVANFNIALTNNTEIQLYRIVQELIQNVIKHSKASNCEIVLSNNKSEITLTFSDNGCGFIVNSIKEGIGLKNIYSRVNSLNGEYLIKSEVSIGTTIIVKLPLS